MQFGDGHPDGCGLFQMEWPYDTMYETGLE